MADDSVYTIGRDEAAARLSVSTRTLDRWLRGGKLKYKTVGRSVFIHAGDFDLFLKKSGKPFTGGQFEQSNETHEAAHIGETTNNREGEVFRKLYEDTREELKTKQEKLEAASFRVGQLETQLKNSVPLLEYKQKEEDFQKKENEFKEEKTRLEQKIGSTKIKFWIALGAAGVLAVGLITLVTWAVLVFGGK